MGHMQASEMAHSGLSLEQAVTWHLQSNHYPPVPLYMVPIALRAIELAEDEDYDSHIDMPAGVTYRGADSARVGNIVEALHLDAFIIGGEYEAEVEVED